MNHKIVVYAKEGCHLCERAIGTLTELQASKSFDLEIIDITKDQFTFEKYFLKIPVIQLDGVVTFEVEEIALPDDCRRKLTTLVANLS